MSKKLLWLVILCLIGVLAWTWLTPTKEPIPNYEELVNRIDSLNSEISLLKLERDSLHNVIDSSKVKVDVIEHWYEKELTDITNQSIADDAQFFSNYLSKIDSGFVNSNNSDSIKENKFNLSRTSETQIGDFTVRKKNRFTTRSKHDTTTITSSKGSANK